MADRTKWTFTLPGIHFPRIVKNPTALGSGSIPEIK
jgi:hypothetical protein